jgi:hypothetical protein
MVTELIESHCSSNCSALTKLKWREIVEYFGSQLYNPDLSFNIKGVKDWVYKLTR